MEVTCASPTPFPWSRPHAWGPPLPWLYAPRQPASASPGETTSSTCEATFVEELALCFLHREVGCTIFGIGGQEGGIEENTTTKC